MILLRKKKEKNQEKDLLLSPYLLSKAMSSPFPKNLRKDLKKKLEPIIMIKN
jgi:hypothetical protein